MSIAIFAITYCIMGLFGLASFSYQKTRVERYGMHHIGANILYIVDELGPPTEVLTIVDEKVYIWSNKVMTSGFVYASGGHNADPLMTFVTGREESVTTNEEVTSVPQKEHTCKLMFRVGKENLIESYGVSGKCDSGTSFINKENLFERDKGSM